MSWKMTKPRTPEPRNPFLKPKVHLISPELQAAGTQNAKEAFTIMGKAAKREAYGTERDGGDKPTSGTSGRKHSGTNISKKSSSLDKVGKIKGKGK